MLVLLQIAEKGIRYNLGRYNKHFIPGQGYSVKDRHYTLLLYNNIYVYVYNSTNNAFKVQINLEINRCLRVEPYSSAPNPY